MIKSRTMRWAEHVVLKEEKRNTYRSLVWKTEGKGPFRRRRRWKVNIKVYLKKIG